MKFRPALLYDVVDGLTHVNCNTVTFKLCVLRVRYKRMELRCLINSSGA